MRFREEVKDSILNAIAFGYYAKYNVDAWASFALEKGYINEAQRMLIVDGMGSTSSKEGKQALIDAIKYDEDR